MDSLVDKLRDGWHGPVTLRRAADLIESLTLALNEIAESLEVHADEFRTMGLGGDKLCEVVESAARLARREAAKGESS